MGALATSADDGSESVLPLAVAQVLGTGGSVAGAGFLIGEGVMVTCAHVVTDSGGTPGTEVSVVFPYAPGAPRMAGEVLGEPWRGPEDRDVAIVRLERTPDGVEPMPLGSATGCQGHRVRSFGFPAQAPPGGHFGSGTASGLLPITGGSGPLLQLTDANDVTIGFSGAPVVDEVTGLVIGMVNAIAVPDGHQKGQDIAYVTPTRTLREIWPALIEREICPYQELKPFTTAHARWFEGRDDAARQVLDGLAGGQRVVLLLGPSGAGKSSLVQAGVLPHLAAGRLPGSDRWLPVLARPGQDLLAELERTGLPGAGTEGITTAVTSRLAADPAHERVVLIIDQFEELLAHPVGDRQGPAGPLDAFEEITEAINSHVALSVILIMRDDFYSQLSALAPRLLDAALPGLLNVPSRLSRDDLEAIITRPARDVGARFQPGLPDQIITDVLAAAPQAGTTLQAPVTVLPLLEVTLSRLWARRHDYDGYLTHDAYRRIGGVTGALATWCDTALNDLKGDQKAIAQRILTALVRPADDTSRTPAVRQQVPVKELCDVATAPSTPDGDQSASTVLATLTRHRIVTTRTVRTPGRPDGDPGTAVAELIHDALIRDWGTLRDWVDQDHRFHEWLHRARTHYARWQEGKEDLFKGRALAEGVDWSHHRSLPGELADFLSTSREHQQAVSRRLMRLNVILATALAMALIAGVAFWQRQTAVAERQVALSRQLAADSSTLIASNPDLASLLAVRAYRTSHSSEAVASLYAAADLPLRHRLTGHADTVDSAAFSPDGHTLATAGFDGTVRLWDVATGATRTTLTLAGRTGAVRSVAFSPDGHTLATGSFDGTVRLWDVGTGTTRTTLTGHSVQVLSVEFSPDGRTLASAGFDHTVRLWDVATGTTRTTLTGHTRAIRSVAFSPDGRTLATGSDDGTARLWDVATGTTRTTIHNHTRAVQSVAFSPDGHTLATGDGTARLWDVATGTIRTTLPGHAGAVQSVAFSPDGHTLAAGGDNGTAQLFDVATRTIRIIIIGHTGKVLSVEFSPDGHTLATTGDDRTARLWDVAAGTTRLTLGGHAGAVQSVAFSPDGHTLATGDGTARLWDVATGTIRTTLPGHAGAVQSVAFSPDGHTLATAGFGGTARLWDVATGTIRTTLPGQALTMAFSPDGRTLAAGSDDGALRLWDVATGTIRATLATLAGHAGQLAFSPDGRILAVGSISDGTLRLWDVTTRRIRTTLTGHTAQILSAAFSPDGRTLATASLDHTARLWDVATGTARTLPVHTDTVDSVAFSPDGHTLATGSVGGAARLWDVATGTIRTTLTGHTDTVHSVAFSPDGHTLATGSNDTTARLWYVSLPGLSTAINRICQAVHRDFTPQERSAYLQGQSTKRTCTS